MPHRIQLQRTKGWRKPEGAIVVARPSRWGNPFKVSRFMGGWVVDGLGQHYGVWESAEDARATAAKLYRLVASTYPASWLEMLRGHDLACWCRPDQPCHADVLLKLANSLEGDVMVTRQEARDFGHQCGRADAYAGSGTYKPRDNPYLRTDEAYQLRDAWADGYLQGFVEGISYRRAAGEDV